MSIGIEFVREPKKQENGTVAVFKDLYGNYWDLLQLKPEHLMAKRKSMVRNYYSPLNEDHRYDMLSSVGRRKMALAGQQLAHGLTVTQDRRPGDGHRHSARGKRT